MARLLTPMSILWFAIAPVAWADDAPPEYRRDIAPLLTKYCAGCHNPDDPQGELSLDTYAGLTAGGSRGPAFLAGSSAGSRMIRMMSGRTTPRMPPEDSAQPTAAEIDRIAAWIDAGAKGPQGAEPDRAQLITPHIEPAAQHARAITAIAVAPNAEHVAIGTYGRVALRPLQGESPHQVFGELPGKVNSLRYTRDGKWLIAASGVTGLVGQITVVQGKDLKPVRHWTGHRDTIFVAEPSPDGKLLATASYDGEIGLWDLASGKLVRKLTGHNGAVYDVAFNADGTLLASASGDETVKVWHVASGRRLDTLSQPQGEQYTVVFSPDDRSIVAGGADNRIRVWRLVSRDKPRINPLRYARFAHEGAVLDLVYSPDGKTIFSTAENRTLKAWQTRTYTEIKVFERQSDVVSNLGVTANGGTLLVGRMDGTLGKYAVGELSAKDPVAERPAHPVLLPEATDQHEYDESEPNDAQAGAIELPAIVRGRIHAEGHAAQASGVDVDLYRFAGRQGQQWVLEINAGRSKSPLDSKIEVLTVQGDRILRTRLQAVRDSYITFRGIDSKTRDCRLHNWEEMRQNDYVYLNGEVVKLFLPPRGPDSGFFFYPHAGNRRCYFDTTAATHALNETCYIVRPVPPGETLVPNGLPVFPLYYENDDDGDRRLGRDSQLTFTAPADGDYLVRVSDVRGQQGEAFRYSLTIRPADPGFSVRLQGQKLTVDQGSGREFRVIATRRDGFAGPIRVELANLPAGLTATTPLVIQAGHDIAYGTLRAAKDAQTPSDEQANKVQVTATATVRGTDRQHPVNNFGPIKIGAKPKIRVRLEPDELTLAPGSTATAELIVERLDYNGLLTFEAIEQNLPHGVIIDNIGLNGVLIPAKETRRTIYLTAAAWVPETSRPFFLRVKGQGDPTTQAITIHIQRPEQAAVSSAESR